jgi:hypothetical protein
MGAVVGLVAAFWISHFLVNTMWFGYVSLALDPTPDLRVLGFTVTITVLTGVLFRLAPAWRATRTDPASALQRNASLHHRPPPARSHQSFFLRRSTAKVCGFEQTWREIFFTLAYIGDFRSSWPSRSPNRRRMIEQKRKNNAYRSLYPFIVIRAGHAGDAGGIFRASQHIR